MKCIFFNIADDLGETTNLASEQPEHVAHLRSLLDEWEEGLVEPLWVADQKWQNNQVKKHMMDVIGRDAERKIP